MLHLLASTALGARRICLATAACDVQPDPVVAGGLCVTLAPGKVLYTDCIVSTDIVKSTWQKDRHGARRQGHTYGRCCISRGGKR